MGTRRAMAATWCALLLSGTSERALAQAAPTAPPAPGETAATTASATPARDNGQAAAPEQAENSLADVVVTAQRREERLQRVPLAVTALDAATLRDQNVTGLADVSRVAPNIAISSSGYTAPTNALPVIYIRGIGQQDPAIYSDPGVPVYVDGVYVARSAGGAIDLPDIGRVEVLRGPQGTLFGKNAVGGAVNIVTAAPGARTGADLTYSGGNFGLFEARGVLDYHASDQLGLAAAFDAKHENGYGDRLDVATGRRLGRLGDQRHLSGRLRARWTPSAALTVDLSADYTRYRDTATPGQTTIVPSGLLTLWNARVGTPQGLPISQAVTASGRYDNFSRNSGAVRDDLGGVSGTIAYDLGGVTLKSITAYREAHDVFNRDADSAPAVYLEVFRDMKSRQFTQELQLLGRTLDDRLDYIVGGFYLHDRANQLDYVPLTPGLYPQIPQAAQDRPRTYVDAQTTNSYAAYAQATLRPIPAIGLTAGVRYTDESKDAVVSAVSPQSGIVYVPATPLHDRWTAWTPRFALDGRVSDTVLLYASASRGFKSGGFNGRPANPASLTTFDPETVWSYEAGLKSELLQHHARANLAVFQGDYRNIQLSRQTIINGVNISDINNVAASRIRGAEGELTLLPARGLELDGSLGYTHNRYTQVQPGAIVTADNKIPYAPKWTWTLSARYRAELSGGTLTPSVNFAYRSSTYVTPNNSPVSLLDGYGLLAARLSFTPTSKRWDLAAFATNLTDKRYRISVGDSTGAGLVYNLYGRPREVGATLGLHL